MNQLLLYYSFRIQLEAKVSSKEDLRKVKQTETRILLLYATRAEGENIMKWATEFGLTTKNYIWIATQSVISKEKRALNNFPPGMLGM
jgi:ionotropic glutamate receptor NMDA 2B